MIPEIQVVFPQGKPWVFPPHEHFPNHGIPRNMTVKAGDAQTRLNELAALVRAPVLPGIPAVDLDFTMDFTMGTWEKP